MEQKTILQEMLEQSSVGKKNKLRIESAYRLSAKGKYVEAAEIFDELLREDPDDQEALSGKKMNDWRIKLDGRVTDLAQRRRETASEAKKERGPVLKNALRSKKVLAGLVIAFVLVCAAAAAAVGITSHGADIGELEPAAEVGELSEAQ